VPDCGVRGTEKEVLVNTVGIDPNQNTVTIGNPQASPVPTLDTENPAKQPFQDKIGIFIPDGALFGQDSTKVPAGKRLVIEYVGMHAGVQPGQKVLFVRVQTIHDNPAGQDSVDHVFGATFQGHDSHDDKDIFITSQTTRLYADVSVPVQFFVNRDPGAGTGFANITISGYLVDVP
jgi:hypothetical protein